MFQSVPKGFFSANERINAMPVDVVDNILKESFAEHTSTQKISESLPNGEVSQADLEVAVNAIAFTLRQLPSEGTVDELKGILAKHTDLSDDVVTKLLTARENSSQKGELKRCLSLGRLVGMEWKLGVGIASSKGRALNAPYISLLVKIQESSGVTRAHPMELSLGEFQVFARTFRSIHDHLESV